MQAVLARLTCLIRKQIQRIYEFSTESAGARVRLEILRMIKEEYGKEAQHDIAAFEALALNHS